ncbi:GIY-YIG nuclease family protein [Bacillus sp. UNC41MFS5]|uniref:GIY-YIG nuclease family protein n=1 Tax=Bacillus sp. UNC41MFS5 TaxID=1449046 RepID=UPI0004791A70|nr:GIY-YIG nuclease family protein [Bacillus sp. UNC41MFS5]
MCLKDKVKHLPSSPGVYLMKDTNGQIIYVGKAKNLKIRVRSYFQNSKAHTQKIIKLKASLKDFDYFLTDTEFEAFMLECELIRELKPIFNRMMKSPQSYVYIRIRMDGDYQRLDICKNPDKPDSLYFGPYTNKHTVEKALLGIKDFYQINCSTPSYQQATPCINYSIGLCLGMCKGGTALNEYNERMNKILALLQGFDTSLPSIMEQKMIESSEKFDFEAAGKYRDTLNAIHSLLNKEKVIEFTESNKKIAVIAPLTDRTFKLFLIQKYKILFTEKFNWSDSEAVHKTIKNSILTIFKASANNSFNKLSRDEIDAAQIIYSYLKGSNCTYIIISEQFLTPSHASELDNQIYKLMQTYMVNR